MHTPQRIEEVVCFDAEPARPEIDKLLQPPADVWATAVNALGFPSHCLHGAVTAQGVGVLAQCQRDVHSRPVGHRASIDEGWKGCNAARSW